MGDQIRKMGLARHVERMGDSRGEYTVLVGRPEGKRPLGRPNVEGKITLKWMLKKWDGGLGTGLIWLRTGTGDGPF